MGAADAHFYCSGMPNASTFSAHILTLIDSLLVHAQGDVSWLHNSFENDDGDFTSLDLTVGDLLHIPKGLKTQGYTQDKTHIYLSAGSGTQAKRRVFEDAG